MLGGASKTSISMAGFLTAAADWPMEPAQLKRQWRMIVQLHEAEVRADDE